MNCSRILIAFALSLVLLSCEDDEKQRQAETLRTAQHNDSILKIISSNWRFAIQPLSAKAQARVDSWNEWMQFKGELAQKPTGNLIAYRQKTKNLVNKADLLKNNIPLFFDKPQVRSRISVLITKVKSLYTYTNLAIIQDKKITALINEITIETTSLQNQLEELIRISEIPKEMGEEEMLRALDTVRRANPGMQPQP